MLTYKRENTCCFTGHRSIPLEHQELICKLIEKTLLEYINNGYSNFCTGGALGFDTLAAQAIINLACTHPHIRLILVLPCQSQARYWSEQDYRVYENIKKQAHEIIYTSNQYTRGCMFKRNRHLVDMSSLCVCYLTKNKGGTLYTVNYAAKNRLKVINIAEDI